MSGSDPLDLSHPDQVITNCQPHFNGHFFTQDISDEGVERSQMSDKLEERQRSHSGRDPIVSVGGSRGGIVCNITYSFFLKFDRTPKDIRNDRCPSSDVPRLSLWVESNEILDYLYCQATEVSVSVTWKSVCEPETRWSLALGTRLTGLDVPRHQPL